MKHIRVIKFILLYLTCIANILLCCMNTDNLFDWRFQIECTGKWMRTKMAVLLYSSIPFPGANCTVPFFRSASYLGTSLIKVKKSACVMENTYLYNVTYDWSQSTARKEMATVHSATIPCRPNTAHEAQRKPYFYNIIPVLRTMCRLGLKIS